LLYDNGDDLGVYTQEELAALADRVMGDRVATYRARTGKILGRHANDMDRGFLKFFAWRYWNNEQEQKKAADTIRSYEADLSKWQVLCLAVDEWQEFVVCPEKFQKEAVRRSQGKKASQLDKDVAAETDAQRFERLAKQQERQQAASPSPVVDMPQKPAATIQEAASRQPANKIEREPMTAEAREQWEKTREYLNGLKRMP
jgi:hypothetical protein